MICNRSPGSATVGLLIRVAVPPGDVSVRAVIAGDIAWALAVMRIHGVIASL
jgi:hypothetical protein